MTFQDNSYPLSLSLSLSSKSFLLTVIIVARQLCDLCSDIIVKCFDFCLQVKYIACSWSSVKFNCMVAMVTELVVLTPAKQRVTLLHHGGSLLNLPDGLLVWIQKPR